ncbi:hypothetical protein ACFPM3_13320 [Streptomyces coeruleoprunus]|uniref:Uncharacterized protein n=1 Tax=Streptomyces coeruleoprunus TaxID=285563 RepID=A0ABV9XGK0_9ACTN
MTGGPAGGGAFGGDPYRVLARAAAEWDVLEPLLGAEGVARLGAALRRLREAAGARDAAVEAARVLAGALPPGEGGRLVTTAGPPSPGAYAGFRAEDLAVLVLDRHRMVGPVLGPVRERLLAVPALSDEDVRGRGGDPFASGLIRLRGEGGVGRLPRFQFSEDALPWLVVLEVNALLGADEDPWGAADWWLSENAWLASAPVALLGSGLDERLVGAAHALVDGV